MGLVLAPVVESVEYYSRTVWIMVVSYLASACNTESEIVVWILRILNREILNKYLLSLQSIKDCINRIF